MEYEHLTEDYAMKFDSSKIHEMLGKSDEEMWREIRMIGSARGVTLPEMPPSTGEMQKIRHALGGAEKMNLSQALSLINNYRKSGGK